METIAKFVLSKINPDILLKLRLYKLLIGDKSSFLWTTGFSKGLKTLEPIDNHESPIPWMNYSFIAFISQRLNSRMDIFEFGSGYSTNYWAKAVNTVTSVEYDKKWFQKIGDNLPNNVKLIFNDNIDSGEYAKSCLEQNSEYDVIIIDGRKRVDCLQYSLPNLKQNGVVILDDSHRERYVDGFKLMKDNGFKEITITGVKPISSSFAATTVFYRTDNCLNI